jgi:hydrogenase expression/formation protein HypE
MNSIQLAHGGGGRLSRDLIEKEILSRFGDGPLKLLSDAALLPEVKGRLVFTTDSFVVQPLEFPGGNIGDLAVHGTVNDLAVSGAKPLWLSLAMILEEGLSFDVLRRVLDSVKVAADKCGVKIVTGDTKVVAKGQCDGMFLNTAGVGELIDGFDLSPDRIVVGDKILVSGPLGDHGMAVMSRREGINIQNGPVSDSAPVHRLVNAIKDFASHVRFMRDPTRGGLASVLNEAVEKKAIGIELSEEKIPFSSSTKAVAEMLGLDLLHVASEGRMIAVCDASIAENVLALWRKLPEGQGAVSIGQVVIEAGRVILRTITGGRRLVDVPRGELLPRIC